MAGAGNPNTLLLHSGGLDSHILWRQFPTATPLYVRHGAANELAELAALERLKEASPGFDPHIVNGPHLGPLAEADSHIPHRNLNLILTAVTRYPTARRILYGALRGEASADKSPAFVAAATQAVTESEGVPVEVAAPFLHLTKTQVVRLGLDTLTGDELAATHSCYTPGLPCGWCQACFRRDQAFAAAEGSPMPHLPDAALTRGPIANLLDTPPRRWPDLAAANASYLTGRLKEILRV